MKSERTGRSSLSIKETFAPFVTELLDWMRLLWITAIELAKCVGYFIVGAIVFLAALRIGLDGLASMGLISSAIP